jgi:hypothetical protein
MRDSNRKFGKGKRKNSAGCSISRDFTRSNHFSVVTGQLFREGSISNQVFSIFFIAKMALSKWRENRIQDDGQAELTELYGSQKSRGYSEFSDLMRNWRTSDFYKNNDMLTRNFMNSLTKCYLFNFPFHCEFKLCITS